MFQEYKKWSQDKYPLQQANFRSMMEMSKYLCDVNAANFMMSNKQKLFLIRLLDGEVWRAHSQQIFHYQNGAWSMVSVLSIEVWEIFMALEGLFLKVAEHQEGQERAIGWEWGAVSGIIEGIVLADPIHAVKTLIEKAKQSSDPLRKETGNKSWKANWMRRVADMLASFRLQWDASKTQVLSKLFLQEWDTPLPKSRGVCFTDIYLDPDWRQATKSPRNDCYNSVPYPFFYESLLSDRPDLNLENHKQQLRVFLESLYFANAHVFQLKLAFLHAAFQRACTSKMIFEVGKGGDGKGMEAYLEMALRGSDQSATLDCGVFLDRQEFRKSGHFAWNKSCLGLR